jgi:sulfonate transport system substrate-binding protein
MQRRDLMWLAGLTAPGLCLSLPALAIERELRIGIQKYGSLVLLKERGLLEQRLEPQGWSVTWTEFPGGPQLLEALNVGAIDFGTTGEAPPIFAQAAGAPLLYVGYEPPAPRGEAILRRDRPGRRWPR